MKATLIMICMFVVQTSVADEFDQYLMSQSLQNVVRKGDLISTMILINKGVDVNVRGGNDSINVGSI